MSQKLRRRATADGVDPLETLHHCMGNLLNDLVFGKVYEEDDEVWKWLRYLQEEGVKHIGVAGPLNFLPFLRYSRRYLSTKILVGARESRRDLHSSLTKGQPRYVGEQKLIRASN